MAIAVDTSVIMDVLLDDPEFASRSRIAIESAAAEEGLVISETVVAEIVPALDAGAVEEFLADLEYQVYRVDGFERCNGRKDVRHLPQKRRAAPARSSGFSYWGARSTSGEWVVGAGSWVLSGLFQIASGDRPIAR